MRNLEIPSGVMEDVRRLRIIMEGHGSFPNADEREKTIDRIKDHISDLVITLLIEEDRVHFNNFMQSR